MNTFCFGVHFQEALMKGLAAMKQHKATKWLSDNQNNGALPREDEEWADTVWVPAALAAGWKHWALVQPAKVIGLINSKRFVKKMSEIGLNAHLFSDPDEAMKWLEDA